MAWLCLCVYAQLASVCAAAPAAIPEQTGLVVDQAGALNAAERAALTTRLTAIQAAGHAQIAVLISNGTHGEPLAPYALRVAEAWKLGRAGRDDGLLIVVVPSSGAARIEVGYGLEGEITDARSSRWVDELLAAVKQRTLATGLDHLLDQIDAVLAQDAPASKDGADESLFPDHPEWQLPFVLAIFSPLALFPMFIGRWGSIASACLFALFLGIAAWMLWQSVAAASAVAGAAFALPLLWGLNWVNDYALGRWGRSAKGCGNALAVALFFLAITLFVGAGLRASGAAEVWAAPLFAAMMALGLAAFLFPGKPAGYLMIVLRSAMHFAVVLTLAYVALQPFMVHPSATAFAVAAAFTACVALALYLDHRARVDQADAHARSTAAHWLIGLALLLVLPAGLLLLVQAALGDDTHARMMQAATGGGSLAGALWGAARFGFFATLEIGLGGRFGGGGAGRGE